MTNLISWTMLGEVSWVSENGKPRVVSRDGVYGVLGFLGVAIEMIDNYADAVPDVRDILIVTSVDECTYSQALAPVLSSFHGRDIDFYYESIKRNIKE